jgi:hypothetical protein
MMKSTMRDSAALRPRLSRVKHPPARVRSQ